MVSHYMLCFFLLFIVAPCTAFLSIERFVQHSVKVDTGFETGTLQYIWDKYHNWNGSPPGTFGGQLPQRQRQPEYAGFYFYLVFVYMHKCPQLQWIESFASADGQFKASTTSFVGVTPLRAIE